MWMASREQGSLGGGGEHSGYFRAIWESLGGGPLCEIERAAIISGRRIDMLSVHPGWRGAGGGHSRA